MPETPGSHRRRLEIAGAVCAIVSGVFCAAGRAAAPRGPRRSGDLLARVLSDPEARSEEIVFAVRGAAGGHWYETFGRDAKLQAWRYGRGGGRLCRLNLRTGRVTTLLADAEGGVRDPHVHYDAGKVLFSYRKGGTHTHHLYEINVDGTGRRQITDGPWDDIEPIYTPAGEIVFISSRCRSYVPCWCTQVAILYACGRDGRNIRPLSSNTEHENTPQVLPDGRILYTRWEYIDRNNVAFHHLWTVNPDGTGQMTFFGNAHPNGVYIDAMPIGPRRRGGPAGTGEVVMVYSPGHGRSEHRGRIAIVDPEAGPDRLASMRFITRAADYRDPCPITPGIFLVARGKQLLLMDRQGATQPVYTLREGGRQWWVHEPRPLRCRPREPVIPDRTDPGRTTGSLVLADVRRGRNLPGVGAGEIRKLLILETLPKPISFNGWMGPVSFKRSYFLKRILGTVPVEPDGSAHFELPALRPVLFVALDEADHAVKHMRSFTSVMPGETTGCVGCHEARTDVPPVRPGELQALRKPPAAITPLAGVPGVLDFPRDIQPILDRHCIRCHNYDRPPPADLPLIGARGVWFSHSYFALTSSGYASVESWRRLSNDPPRKYGSGAARIVKVIEGGHHKTRLSAEEKKLIRLWIDCNSPYAGTYAALGTGMVPLRVSGDVLLRRCGACHPPGKDGKLPRFKESYGHEPWFDRNYASASRWPALRRTLPMLGDHPAGAERLYNLTAPEKSPVLLAPLAKAAGGWGVCRPRKKANTSPARDAAAVFADTADPDYRKILADVRATRRALDEVKRFDMPGFRPSRHYVREMKRYGILPPGLEAAREPIDVYATDETYWRSFWHVRPGSGSRAPHGGARTEDVGCREQP